MSTRVVVVALAETEREFLLRLLQAELEAGSDRLIVHDLLQILENAHTAEELRGVFSMLESVSVSRAQLQARVAKDKEAHPGRYCPEPRCLWHTGDGSYCPRHRSLGLPATLADLPREEGEPPTLAYRGEGGDDWLRVAGWFYGYPACCIEAFIASPGKAPGPLHPTRRHVLCEACATGPPAELPARPADRFRLLAWSADEELEEYGLTERAAYAEHLREAREIEEHMERKHAEREQGA